MSMSSAEKGNFMVVGSTGGGKTTFCYEVLKKRLSRKQCTDWLRLRNVIRENRAGKTIKPEIGHHDE